MLIFPVLNRSVLLVIPKQPFYDWSDALTPDFPKTDIKEHREYNSYLLNGPIHLEDERERELKQYWKQIFINELSGFTDDPSEYPELTWDLFTQWFDFMIANFAHDLLDAPIDCEYF